MHKVTHGAPFSSTTFTTTIQHQPDSTDEENRLRRESPPPLASVSKHFDAQHVVFYALSCRTPLYRYPFVPQLLLRPVCQPAIWSSIARDSWDLAPSSCISKKLSSVNTERDPTFHRATTPAFASPRRLWQFFDHCRYRPSTLCTIKAIPIHQTWCERLAPDMRRSQL
jgi:hypothetical protein